MAAAFLAPRWAPAPQLVENRVLAAAPPLPTRLSEARAFRKAVDAYVADNFPIRPHLIGTLNRLRMLVGVSGSERVIVGREGWLFFDNGSHLGSVRNDPPLGPSDTRAWLTFIAGSSEAHKAHGAAFLMLIPPMKETIYPEHLPAWYPGASPERPALALPKLARAAGAGEVLYLYDAVAAATQRGEKTYSRHDTHWTSYGAYAGYVALMAKLREMGVTQDDALPVTAFNQVQGPLGAGPRDLALMLGVSSFVDVDFPHFADPVRQARVQRTYLSEKEDWTGPLFLDTGEVGKPVLMMRRDSFSNGLIPFLFPHFSRLVLIHADDREWRQDLIDRFKPDVVILETIEAGAPVAIAAAPPPSAEAAARIEAVVRELPATVSPLIPTLKPIRGRALRRVEKAKAADRCNVEVATLIRARGQSALLTVGGWTADFATDDRSPKGVLRLQGPGVDLVSEIRVDNPRPDVAGHFQRPAVENSGFSGEFAVPGLPPGEYRVTVYRRSQGGWIGCAAREPLTAK